MKRKNLILSGVAVLAAAVMPSQAATFWNADTTAESISYLPREAGPHNDHLEMSGKRVAAVVRYGVDEKGAFGIDKSLVWPGIRTIPNNTHGSLMRHSAYDVMKHVHINGVPVTEQVEKVCFDGVLSVYSEIFDGVSLERHYFPSTEAPAFMERFVMGNHGNDAVYVEVPGMCQTLTTPEAKGVDGSYEVTTTVEGSRTALLRPGETMEFGVVTRAHAPGADIPVQSLGREEASRRGLVASLMESLVLDTPDLTLNRMFAFSKLRACESIFETKGGPLHSPGGETYYAAIWANDEAEYANPLFAFTGYAYADSSAVNSFRHFARYVNPDLTPVPSSIVAEGTDIWNGAGDRGDAAMIAYGAARYALAGGDRKVAEELWPLVEWCLDYCDSRLNESGVVKSDHDELEGRFPAGSANLCTSSLYYDALLSAARLGRELGKKKTQCDGYSRKAASLAKAIERYFGREMEGFDTYAYYEGNDVLRSWICIPLTVGIFDRTAGTTDALFSDRLWTGNGLLTQAGTTTYWDRSTLYALRGVIYAGETERAMPYLRSYSQARLLGEHVPYAIEAWPEGNQRHLSAESALYARVFTEGLFGIRPTGLRSFDLTPRLPSDWDHMALRHVKAFGSDFDIEVRRLEGGRVAVDVTAEGKKVLSGKYADGRRINVKL